MPAAKLSAIEREFEGAALGDERRNKRLMRLVGAVGRDPSGSFPRAMGSDAELEAFYRFINNDSFSAEAILAPHVEATLRRGREARSVLVLHDSTYVELPGPPERGGMGVTTTNNRRGFLAHVSLITTEVGPVPLGVAHVSTLTRTGTKWKARKNRAQIDKNDKGRESTRWLKAMEAIEAARGDDFEAIHVTDAEGDFFEFLSTMHSKGARFVIRAAQLNRMVSHGDDRGSLRDAIDQLRPNVFRDVELNARKYAPGSVGSTRLKKHPPREARTARCAVASTRLRVERTRYTKGSGEPFDINIVRVWEPHPPDGRTAVEWVLFTTEPVSSKKQQLRVVDIYRQRWLIEDYFKALKSGCSLEKRQVDSYSAMRRVLCLLLPLAYRLLRLRGLSRTAAQQSASIAFDPTDLILIARAQPKPANVPKKMADALALLAKMGGHITNNGPPGWMTLGAGYEKLLLLKLGFEMGRDFG
jgi:Transposase DNA-binding/Transposase DDE domain